MKWNPHDNFRSVQVAHVQVLTPSCHDDKHLSLSSSSVTIRASVILAFPLVISVASLEKSASPTVIPAKAGIYRGSHYAPPITTDSSDYL